MSSQSTLAASAFLSISWHTNRYRPRSTHLSDQNEYSNCTHRAMPHNLSLSVWLIVGHLLLPAILRLPRCSKISHHFAVDFPRTISTLATLPGSCHLFQLFTRISPALPTFYPYSANFLAHLPVTLLVDFGLCLKILGRNSALDCYVASDSVYFSASLRQLFPRVLTPYLALYQTVNNSYILTFFKSSSTTWKLGMA